MGEAAVSRVRVGASRFWAEHRRGWHFAVRLRSKSPCIEPCLAYLPAGTTVRLAKRTISFREITMARKPTDEPVAAKLSVKDMTAGVERINKRIEELDAFDPDNVPERRHHSVAALSVSIEETLARVFNKGSEEYTRYRRAASLDNGPVAMGASWGGRAVREPFRRYLQEGKERSLALLRQAVRGLEEEIELQSRTSAEINALTPVEETQPERSAFIVHGRDGHPREAVARFLERIGFRAVVLHEQPNGGQTIIEKFERHGNVGFAVVLLTPDDVGGLAGDAGQRPRARQNVILELGYFIGKLGRSRVVALKAGDIELPSDFVGVAYQEFDAGGGWQRQLAGELQAAGYDIDWNIIMKMGAG